MNRQQLANRIEYLIGEIEELDSSVEQEAETIFEYRQELEKLEAQEEVI